MNERPEILNDEAIKLSQNGFYSEAIACFKRAIVLEKDNYLLWYNLGLTFRDAGFLPEASESLEKAKELLDKAESINEDVSEALAVTYFDLGKFEEAIEICDDGLKENPENPELWNTLGAVYFNQGNFKSAQDSFEAAVILNPYYPEALFNLRDTYKELKNQAGYEECKRRLGQIKKNI